MLRVSGFRIRFHSLFGKGSQVSLSRWTQVPIFADPAFEVKGWVAVEVCKIQQLELNS